MKLFFNKMNRIKIIVLVQLFLFMPFIKAKPNTNFNEDSAHFLANLYLDSWAVIIGINDYEHMPNLNYAVNDAVDIKEMLISKYNFKEDHIKIILNEEATKNNIIEGFHQLLQKSKDKDRVVIFYAGHGETYTLPNGGEMGYLIPVDGDPEKLYLTSIPMSELYEIAQMSYAKHILYLVDACYGGLALASTRGLAKSTPNFLRKITSEKGRQIITAGGKDEQVIERSEWGHSAFTKNLLIGLGKNSADIDDDGVITANELGRFMSERVYNETDGYHTPQTGRIGTEMGEFIFFNSSELADETSFLEYQKKSLERKNTYMTAKKLSWAYPGLGHMKMDQKRRGITLLTLETLSLAMAFVSKNNMNTSYDQYISSYQAYSDAVLPGELANTKEQYLSDYEAYQSTEIQFYSAVISSLAVWVYNIYDVKKQRYNYTDNKQYSIFDISFKPDNQIIFHINF